MALLSLLDLATVIEGGTASQALAETTEMARVAEDVGMHRLWVAEHHGMPGVASSSPAVLVAHLAASTTTLRVGSGGIMLPNHAPLVIAEQFGTLEALHAGRIDLGIGRAPGTDLRTARALGRGDASTFPDDLVELIGYFTGASEHLAIPGRGLLPEIWLLGSSTYSAQLAGMLGLPFSFAFHFSPASLDAALLAYRSNFRASAVLDEPRTMVAAAVLCAPTTEEAIWLAGPSRLSMLLLRRGQPSTLMAPEMAAAWKVTDAERQEMEHASMSHIVGDPAVVRDGLTALLERTSADEIMISSRVHDLAQRARSVRLVAEAWAGR
jgi:hypothetical protein